MKVKKITPYRQDIGEKVKRNDEMATDRLINGMSRLDCSIKYHVTNTRVDQITSRYVVVQD